MHGKLGALRSEFEPRHLEAAEALAKHFNSLGTPPATSNNWAQHIGDWEMDGNDECGDCMIACCAHAVMQTSSNINPQLPIIPSSDYCKTFYEEESGWNGVLDDPSDAGTDTVTLTDFLATNEFDGVQLLASAPVHINNPDHIKWAIQKFGGVRFCLSLPQSAMNQFNAGLPWDVVPMNQDGGIVGGHCVFGSWYRDNNFYVVTWGKLILATPAFLARYLFEAHAEAWSSWLGADGKTPLGDTIQSLKAVFPSLAKAPSHSL